MRRALSGKADLRHPRLSRDRRRDADRRLEEQAAPFAPIYHLGQQVERLARQADGRFRLETSRGTAILARAVIIAAGVGAFGPNRPPLDGIEAL